MALLFKFELAIMSAEVYDHLVPQLEEAGAGAPPGRLYHVAYGRPDRLKVVDVWDSAQHFQEFGETLVPTLAELDVVLQEPDVWQIYNIMQPQRTPTEVPTPLLVKFDPPRMNAGHYNEIAKRLDEAGHGEPPERLYHACYYEGDQLAIISVWQSEDALRAFFDQLVRITVDLGIPEIPRTKLVIEEVHHIIDGSHRPLLPRPPRGQGISADPRHVPKWHRFGR